MSLPTTQQVKCAIEGILSSARDSGELSQLTVRIVRRQLTARFCLEEDVFETGEYKSFVKETVHATLERLQNASEGDMNGEEKSPKRKVAKKDGSGASKAAARKRVTNNRVYSSDEQAESSEVEAPPPKKASAPSTTKPGKSTKTSKKPESEMKYKSKAVIESSDDEAAAEPELQRSASSSKVEPVSASPAKQKLKKAGKGDANTGRETGKSHEPSGSNSGSKDTAQSKSSSKGLALDPMESELSSIIDEPPTKRQKKQEKESVKPQKDEKPKRSKKEALSKDEETVNKLKSIVGACGVRKVWKKEFDGLDRPSQQIKRLHSILGDLGMKPRYSLEKAKAIREQRELAQELKDVQDFEKATKRRDKRSCSSPDPGVPDQSGSDVDVPVQKKHSARASIMAFLQDQSDEE